MSAFARELRAAERRAQRPYHFRGPLGGGMGKGSHSAPVDVNFGALLDMLCGAGTTVGYYRGDLGLHKTGSVVNRWDNQITTGTPFSNCVEVSAGVGIANASAGVNSKAGLLANGTTQQGAITTVPQPLVAPATTPLSVYAVMISPTVPTANAFLLGVGFNYTLLQTANGTVFEQFNGTAQPTALVTNSWGRTWASFTGTTADKIKWGAGSVATGTNSGNAVGGNGPIGLFGDGTGSFGFAPFGLVLLLFSRATPTAMAAAVPSMDTAVTQFYAGPTPILV